MNECEYCGGKMATKNVVHNTRDEEIYRQKRCVNCGHEIYTVEFEVEENRRFKEEWNKLIRLRVNDSRNKNK